MGHWTSTSPTRGRLRFGRRAWMWSVPLLLFVIPAVFLGLSDELPVILGWAFAATLSWHAICVRHCIEIDRNTGRLTHSLSSLYPIARLDVPLDEISGFCITKTAFERHRYSLMLMMSDGQRVCLFRKGRKTRVEKYGKQLAEFCQRPFREEISTS